MLGCDVRVLIKSSQVTLCLHSWDHGGEQGARGTQPTLRFQVGQQAALLELLCPLLFIKDCLDCPMCYVPVQSDLIIFLWFRPPHVFVYAVKILLIMAAFTCNGIQLICFLWRERPNVEQRPVYHSVRAQEKSKMQSPNQWQWERLQRAVVSLQALEPMRSKFKSRFYHVLG